MLWYYTNLHVLLAHSHLHVATGLAPMVPISHKRFCLAPISANGKQREIFRGEKARRMTCDGVNPWAGAVETALSPTEMVFEGKRKPFRMPLLGRERNQHVGTGVSPPKNGLTGKGNPCPRPRISPLSPTENRFEAFRERCADRGFSCENASDACGRGRLVSADRGFSVQNGCGR
jgi:hypothetical protein